MNQNKIKGVLPALLTPFDKNGGVNEKALRELIELNIRKGVSGFYVCGSTAEVYLLSKEERAKVYRIVSDAVNGRVALIAHVGAISTDESIQNAKIAKECGYDAVSAIAPFYYKFSFEQIKKHYYAIVDRAEMPMVIYNFPNFSGVNLTVEQARQFLCDDRFIGIKHTSNDYFALNQFKKKFPSKVIYNGFDEMFLAGLAMGADGGIGSTYNFMAEKFIEIQKCFRENCMERAYEIQTEACRIISVLCKVGVMEGEKEILCQMGIDFGTARMPFSELTEEQKALLKREVTDRL